MSEIFPEGQPEQVPLTIAGMELSARLPQGVIPVSALVVVRCLVADEGPPGQGPDMLWWSATHGLPTWEVSGMCDFVKHGVHADWTEYSLDSGEEEPDA